MLEKGFKEVVDFALEQLGIDSNKNILDFGCGNGRFVEEMRERKLNAYGCDIVPKNRGELFLIRQGLDCGESSQYIRYYYDSDKIPFEDNFFYSIFSYQVFEHIRDLDFSAKEMYRVLSSGGGGKCIVNLLLLILLWIVIRGFLWFGWRKNLREKE